ncbi:MAG: TSUP family transporter [Candidatus Lokiarchaeota archaeon]|nr:TSUP family transporter [Candidatus Lokiarchaeota archaeon]MBD3201000.1 TSUP family transporter [Candidatus Lokiarchaeota archaeon]
MVIENLDISLLFLFIFLGFIGSFLDGSLGMGYGLLSPILIAIGIDPLIVVPTLLISQMTTGFTVSFFHYFYKNVNFGFNTNQDSKATLLFVVTGLIGMTMAFLLAINLTDEFVMLYISIIVISAGLLMLPKIQFTFSWKKMYLLSAIASFNKAISGGGYGPVMTIGQITSGRDAKESVAVTDLSEALLSAYGFILYSIFNSFSGNLILTLELGLVMILSGMFATPIGAFLTKKLKKKSAKKIIGCLSLIIGIITLIRVILAFL